MKTPTEIEKTKAILKSAGLKPKEYLGQNFLVDEEVLSAILEAASLQRSDTVLEVGPGLGVLTRKLVQRAKRVVAVEKDHRLFSLLTREYPEGQTNLELVLGDILKFHIAKVIAGKYKVVANIPYYLTSKLISNLLELPEGAKPEMLVLMIQKEVAERITAPAGETSVLSLAVNYYAHAEIVRVVPKDCFWPVPEVDSAVIRIVPKKTVPKGDAKKFFRLIHLSFSGKRKQLHNTLGKALGLSREELDHALSESGLDSSARPQQLSLEQWLKLTERLDVMRHRKN